MMKMKVKAHHFVAQRTIEGEGTQYIYTSPIHLVHVTRSCVGGKLSPLDSVDALAECQRE